MNEIGAIVLSYGYPKYIPVAERKRRAQRKIGAFKKKNVDLAPIELHGQKLAKTWWAQAWNRNLESYSDYANRIGRGRSYVRNGMVLDLQIQAGAIHALVQGTQSRPYEVDIEIRPMEGRVWEKIKADCEGRIESLTELLEGRFPQSLSELFTAKGSGLFPSPREIDMRCTCPDWAVMCKHVAAVLYGVGVRLDEDPSLFFLLRGVRMEELITSVIEEKAEAMLGKAGVKSRRILEDTDVADMFGIEVEATDSEKNVSNKRK